MRLSTLIVAVMLLPGAACARTAVTRGSPVPTAPADTNSATSANAADVPLASDAAAESILVDVRTLDSGIVVDLRYRTADNFTRAPLPGYEANRALLHRDAAQALALVQRRLASSGVTLVVWDAYRPRRATLAMVEWTQRTAQTHLITDGYIASRSRHNMGVAVDLTIADAASGAELDMGTPYDTFDERAHAANATGAVLRNRQRLRAAMEAQGFRQYDKEWWHYSYGLADARPFDLPIR